MGKFPVVRYVSSDGPCRGAAENFDPRDDRGGPEEPQGAARSDREWHVYVEEDARCAGRGGVADEDPHTAGVGARDRGVDRCGVDF